MDLHDSAAVPASWSSQADAKQAVIEQALLKAINPFSELQEDKQPIAERKTVITYTVQAGDTLSEIAYQYGVDLRQLVEENKITNPHFLSIGMKIVISRNEVVHTVAQGETLEQIAEHYQVDKKKIIARNPLLRILPDNLYIGQVLYVPVPSSEPMLAGNVQLRRQMAQAASRSAVRARAMAWPLSEPTITSGFGMRWGQLHKGIDLWNQQEARTPILAAKDGVVVEAGAVRSGYGYLVILDHGDGLQTYYAHLRKITVRVGQQVKQGEQLGYMGNTGDSTGYHLHFEVRQDDVPVNPLHYLR
ncbi:M23 family metallopeptidase [Brevibacillus marinus]|uniref:M23 family metallopeptidase n=1 Tax=Brevibacillus marinus TaxID=2496837 RepID=UPI000F828779|nr:M23 family metallopeptidase [Brevibacillus marinus]